MTIALDGQLLWGLYSGVERSIHRLVEHLQALDPTNHYLLYVGRDFPGLAGPNPRWRIVPTRVVGRQRLLRIAWQQLVLPCLLRRDRADLLHAPGYVAPLASPVPTVVSVYDLIALHYPHLARPSNVWHYRLFLPPTLRRAAAILVPSAATQREVVRAAPQVAPRVRIVPLGVDERFSVPIAPKEMAAVRRKYALPEKFLLFVGNLEPKKNLPTALAAFAQARKRLPREYQFVLVGAPLWGKQAVNRALAHWQLEGQVRQLGYVADADLPALYRTATLFVFPSLVEGFGLPPLEAMASGTPVVCSNRGALPEVVGEAALMVEAEDAEALAEAMVQILTNEELRTRLRAQGRERARQFSWEQTARQVMQVYADAGSLPFGGVS
ncbi:MAG TPA: glycosyltransferase family 1 protein [Armatimonadetes bacterium]|nr:glycosyltransferase family 1 protein [Armatimonadota bacterium]